MFNNRSRIAVITIGLTLLSWQSASAALVSYWDFNQDAGGGESTLIDVCGKNTGKLYDGSRAYTTVGENGTGPEFVSGRPEAGNALRFNDATYSGSTVDAVELDNSSFPTGKADFTISGWFKSGPVGESHAYILSNGKSGASGIALNLGRAGVGDGAGKLQFAVKGVDSDDIWVLSDKRLDDGKWHWFAATAERGVATLYVDGVVRQGARVSYKATTSATPYESRTFIGARLKTVEGFSGLVDDVAVFDKALSRDELSVLYTQGSAAVRSGSGLMEGQL